MDNKLSFGEGLALVIVIIMIIGLVAGTIVNNSDKREITLTVTDKTVKTSKDDGKYMVYCKDADENIHVLEITDTLLRGRFDSSDEYAAIEIGKTYKFTVVGKRIPIFSMYPNILSHKEV